MEIYTNSVRLENGVFEILESQKEVSDVRKKICILFIAEQGVVDEVLAKRENEDERNKIIDNYPDIQKQIIIKYIDGLVDYETGSSNYDKNFKIKIDKDIIVQTWSGVELFHKGDRDIIARNIANYAFYLAITNGIPSDECANLFEQALIWRMNNAENMIQTKIIAKTLHSDMNIKITNDSTTMEGHPNSMARILLSIKEILLEDNEIKEEDILKGEADDDKKECGIIYKHKDGEATLKAYGSLKNIIVAINKSLERLEVDNVINLKKIKTKKEEVIARSNIKIFLKEKGNQKRQ